MNTMTVASPLGSRRHVTSSAEANESTDISVESSILSDGSDAIECGSSLPSARTDPSVQNITNFDQEYNGRSDRNRKTSERNTTRVPVRRRSNRWTAVVVGMMVLIGSGLGIYFYLSSNNISLTKRTESSIETSNSKNVTLEELQSHNDPTSDCWVSMHDTVFDVTAYALEHPGGPEFIWDYCGTNATRAFAIEHPVSYLKDLSRNTIMGVLQESTGDTSASQPTDEGSGPTAKPKQQVDEDEDEEDDSDEDEDDGVTGSTTVGPTTDGTATDAPTTTTSCISASDVALHATRDDCWYILYNQVYDFTDYIDLHPGGARYVFQECGTDATSVYVNERKHDENLLIEVNAPDLYLLAAVC